MAIDLRAFRGRTTTVPVKRSIDQQSRSRISNHNSRLNTRRSKEQSTRSNSLSVQISPLKRVTYPLRGSRQPYNDPRQRYNRPITPYRRFLEFRRLINQTFILANNQLRLQTIQSYRTRWEDKTSQQSIRPSEAFGFNTFSETFQDNFDRGFFSSYERLGLEKVSNRLDEATELGLTYSYFINWREISNFDQSGQSSVTQQTSL